MLKVSAEAAVFSDGCPLVVQNARPRFAGIHHGLNRDDHAFAQLRSMSTGAVIRDLRFFVQLRANAVANEFTHRAEASSFHMLLDSGANIANRITNARLLNSAIQRCFRNFQQFLSLRLHRRAHRHGDRRVAIVTVEHHAAVN